MTSLSKHKSHDEEPGEVIHIHQPSRTQRWLLTVAMVFMLGPMQIIIGVPILLTGIFAAIGSNPTMNPESIATQVLTSDFALWASLGAAAFAGVLTVSTAILWPRFIGKGHIPFEEWFAWRPPRVIKLWMVIPLTILALLIIGVGISMLFEQAGVELQEMLFSTPGLSIIATITVATIVPIAEELVFRGALYQALLPDRDEEPGWRHHIVPFIVVTIAFAAVHLLAGFEMVGAIVQVFLLSAFITAIRAVSGSVIPAVLTHMLWNTAAALAMIFMPNMGV